MIPLISLVPLLAQFGPQLIEYLAGPKAAAIATSVGDIAQEVTGTKVPEAAIALANADPAKATELRLALAKVATEAAADQRRTELETLKAQLAETASARSQTVALAQAGSSIAWAAPTLSLVIVTGFFAAPGVNQWFGVTPDQIWLGALIAGFGAVTQYWLGASASGRRAQEANQAMAADSNARANAAQAHAVEVVKAITPPAPPLALPAPPRPVLRRYAPDGIGWQVTADGVVLEGKDFAERTVGEPVTVAKIWRDYGPVILAKAREFGVPAEVVVMTIATESNGDPNAYRREPDGRESAGLTQALTSTAAELLGRPVSVEDLKHPELAIEVCCRYLKRAAAQTQLDPILAAASYNAGSLVYSAANRWRLRCTDGHLDRAAMWFGDACYCAARDRWFS